QMEGQVRRGTPAVNGHAGERLRWDGAAFRFHGRQQANGGRAARRGLVERKDGLAGLPYSQNLWQCLCGECVWSKCGNGSLFEGAAGGATSRAEEEIAMDG